MRQRSRLPMAALALVAAVPAGTGFLAPLPLETTAALAEMGEAVGLPLSEWGWEKKWAEADGVLPLVIRALDDPLGALEEVRGLGAGTLADDLALLGLAPERAAAPSGETGFGRWRDWALARGEAAAAWRAELGDKATIYEEAAAALLGGSDKGEATLAALADETSWATALPALAGWPPPQAPASLPEPLVEETPFGRIGVGTMGDDLWEGEWLLILDPGGDDTYRLEGGAWTASYVVDMGGNDRYEAGAWPAAGSGILGAGGILDLAGDDQYRGARGAWGVGIGGIGWVDDREGNDRYEGLEITQGAGMAGVGTLTDGAGDDTYRAGRLAQGLGLARGVGRLADLGGDDLYYAMGEFLHQPLYDDRYQSLSQGFAIGMRYEGKAGGVGILYDREGNDRYLAEVYCQGAGYWYGVGILLDEAGNDAYSCHIYGQGAGIHLAAGFLIDGGGDDTYALLDGVGQGGGHDLAVGILHDRGGNDYYAGAGLAQGSGNANALGILIDEGGNDGYVGVKRGVQGWGNAARGFFSAGFLLDMGGDDRYSEGFSAGDFVVRSAYGVVWDRAEE